MCTLMKFQMVMADHEMDLGVVIKRQVKMLSRSHHLSL